MAMAIRTSNYETIPRTCKTIDRPIGENQCVCGRYEGAGGISTCPPGHTCGRDYAGRQTWVSCNSNRQHARDRGWENEIYSQVGGKSGWIRRYWRYIATDT